MIPTSSDNTTDYCDLQLPQASRAFCISLLIIITIVGTIGNSILSYFVIRNTEMRSLINILLSTMAISDAFISCFCAPFDLLTIIYGQWIFGDIMCRMHSFFLSVLVVQNVTILVIMSVDRYCILVQKKDRLKGCHVVTLISFCTIFSIAVSSPSLFDTENVVIENKHCGHIYETSNRGHLIYAIFSSSFLFVLPCGLLLLAYVHIIMSIRKTNRRVRPEFRHPTVSRTNHVRQSRINMKFKQKTFSTILYLYAAAMACKLPLAVSTFVKGLAKQTACPVHHWIRLFIYLNSAINPFIYALKIKEYWMMLTGKFHTAHNRVKSFRRSRNRRKEPQNIYMIPVDLSSSVI